jgi:hypothetical protein
MIRLFARSSTQGRDLKMMLSRPAIFRRFGQSGPSVGFSLFFPFDFSYKCIQSEYPAGILSEKSPRSTAKYHLSIWRRKTRRLSEFGDATNE